MAHINWEHTAGGAVKIKRDNFALTWDEIDLLIVRAADMLNRYSALFDRSFWSMDIAGRDDYMGVLKAVRSELERQDAEIASEIERSTRGAQPESDPGE